MGPQKETENKENILKQQEKKEELKKPTTILEELKYQIVSFDKSVFQNDLKNSFKISKGLRRFKKYLKSHHFKKIWSTLFPNNPNEYQFERFQDFDKSFEENFDISKKKIAKLSKSQEIEFYLKILFVCYLIQNKHIDQAYELSGQLFSRVFEINKKHFDQLTAYIFFYYAYTREIKNQLLQIREQLFDSYRLCCIRHNEIGQATLINLILRNYLHYNHFEPAQHFISKITFPEQAPNNELVRFLYYTGRVKAVQVEYQEAYQNLNQAIKKAPDTTALGFRVEVQKLGIIVEFLMGEIPSRDIFTKAEYWKPLYPYYKLVQTVLNGNLADFTNLVNQYQKYFISDKNYSLIQRLQQTVIKTGLRKINSSYSRISFQDIAKKLNLPQTHDIEFIVAKAIRDNILNAKINHEQQYIVIKQENDLYGSNEPQKAFQKRISYCLNLYNAATKALQYPNTDYKFAGKEEDEEDEDEDISPDDIIKMMEEDN